IKLMGYIDCNYVAPGPFSVYKTDLIRKLGGFDRTSLVEDQEIAYRIQKHHHKIRQCAKAFVYTVAPKNLKELGKQRNRWFKGTFLNLFYYRSLFFNKKYGDFGFFQMPATLVVYIFAFSLLISFFYYLIRPIFLKLYDLYLVGFDFMPYIQNLKFTFNILDVDVASFFIIYLMLAGIFVVMYFSSRMAKDSVTKCGKIHLVPYFFIYFLILAFMAVKVMFEVAIGKKQKW
ncbi:glycosyltransferase family 2 protein, partial [Candidatus Woesearchaeota archaeon]|nr:glycosyltransferase family 2 protein [Candidatus Woesearchaeota archaeon]